MQSALPTETHDGHPIGPEHMNILYQGCTHTRLGSHDDKSEELEDLAEIKDGGEAVRTKHIEYTAIISLAGGQTSLSIMGQHGGEVYYGPLAGAGLLFRSALTHKTAVAGSGIWKMTVFFGYTLPTTPAVPRTAPKEVPRSKAQRWADILWGGGKAPWRRIFAGPVTEPHATPGEGGVMGKLTHFCIAKVLAEMELCDSDVFFDIGAGDGAMLGAVRILTPTVRLAGIEADRNLLKIAREKLAMLHVGDDVLKEATVQGAWDLGSATVAYCFSTGLKDTPGNRGGALNAVLRAAQTTASLRLLALVCDAREKRSNPLVVFGEEQMKRGQATKLTVSMAGGGGGYACYVVGMGRDAAASSTPAYATRTRSAEEDAATIGAALLGPAAPPSIVINLARRQDRLYKMHVLLDKYEWMTWRRIEAVDGKDLRKEQLEEAVTSSARDRLDIATPTVWNNGHFEPRLTWGAVGCALSHRAAWRRLGDTTAECLLVLEDDVGELCENFEKRLQELLESLRGKASWRLCLLGSHETTGKGLLGGRARVSLVELQQGQQSTGLFGYLVHRRALPTLLRTGATEALFPLSQQLDAAIALQEWGHGGRFEARPALLTAPLSEESDDTSDVQIVAGVGPSRKRSRTGAGNGSMEVLVSAAAVHRTC